MQPIFLAMAAAEAGDQMSSWITTAAEVFVSLFQSTWTLVTGNWFLLAGLLIPFVAGLLFAIISALRGNR